MTHFAASLPIGFAAWRSDPLQVERRQTLSVEIRLGRVAVALEPIVVEASAPSARLAGFRDRQRTSATGTFLTREHLERGPTEEVHDVLRRVAAHLDAASAPRLVAECERRIFSARWRGV